MYVGKNSFCFAEWEALRVRGAKRQKKILEMSADISKIFFARGVPLGI